MKKTTLFARLLAGIMTVFFLMGGGVSCSDGSSETKCYTVTFDSNGGSKVDSQTVEEGRVATQPTDPTKEGYTFLGWYNGDTEFDFSTPITADITLTAKWEQIASSGDGEKPGDVEGEKKPDSGDDNPTFGTDPSKPSEPLEEPSKPVITGPVAGKPAITKASKGELETAYVEWTAASNAEWYNVYVKSTGAGEWTQLDGPLVRQYGDYFRADALGLAEGTYDMKVVPVSGEDTEASEYASEATGITVKAHERAGYAFTGGNVPGAYNMDGTLKTGAQVVYVTAATAKTVTATVNGATVTGFQAILDARQKKGIEQSPLCFRIVGTVTASDLDKMSSSAEGLQIKGNSASNPAENITIEGVGSDGTIKDFGMLLRNCRNDEVRNLGILNCMDDGISIDTDNSHLWIHNNDIFYGKGGSGDKAKGDGALDTKGSTLITHSYNHFWDCGKCNLQGMDGEKTDYRITYHHNWYDHSDSRHPRIRTATVHVYNNYFDGNAKYGVGVTMGASAFVENNYFRSTAAMRPMMSSGQGTDATGDGTFSGESGGMIKSFGNKYDCTPSNLKLMTQKTTSADNIDCYEATSRAEKVPDTYKTKSGGTTYNNFDTAADMYEYSVDTAEQAREKVVRYAGRVGGGDLKWEFDNATEDKNYSIIPGLKSAVTGYTASVVKIGGGTASTTPGGNTGTGDEGGNETGGDNTGNTGGSGTQITADVTCHFTGRKANSSVDGAFTINGSYSDSKGSAVVNTTTYTDCLKMERSTSISFKIESPMTLTLVFASGESGKSVKVDGTAHTTDSNATVTVSLNAGEHTITKGDSINLFYIALKKQ